MSSTPERSNGNGNDFARLWSGYTIAVVGNQITLLALPLAAILLFGAGTFETGVLVAVRMAPPVVAGLFIGVWVDRLPRRPILVASSVASALVIGSIPVAAALHMLTIGQLYAVAFVAGCLASATDLARGALLPSLVDRAELVGANSRLQGSLAVSQVAGPSLGGILVQALSAPIAMVVDALSFLASAALIFSMRVRESPRAPEVEGSVWHEIVEGLRWLRREPIVFRSVIAITLANVEWFAVQAVLVVYATRDLGLSPALLGVALAASGPASLIGAAFAGRLTRGWGLGPVMIVALFLEAASRLLLPFAGGTPLEATAVLVVSQALVGLMAPLFLVSSLTLRQSITPDRLLGRVNAAQTFVSSSVAPAAALGAGVVAERIGLRPTLFGAGLIAVFASVYLLASPVRRFHSPVDS